MEEFPANPALSENRLARARLSLEGLSCGDAFGERFFLPDQVAVAMIAKRSLPAPPWFFTDDTLMAMSIVSVLETDGVIDQDKLAKSFGVNYDPGRAYGAAMHELLPKLRKNERIWRDESLRLFRGEGSFGNGSAMRVAPLGAYFADDLKKAAEQARLSSMVTHAHPEAVAGAIAVALAATLAWAYKIEGKTPTIAEFLDRMLEGVPASYVRRGIEKARALPQETPIETAVAALGNGSAVTAPDTVPLALWVAARHLNNYEEAMWATVSALGDRDTTCAIAGGIVVMHTGVEGIPSVWLEHREEIPVCR